MPKGGRPSVQLWAALGSRCQRLCFSPMKFTPSLLKSALLLDPVTNESNLGWVPLDLTLAKANNRADSASGKDVLHSMNPAWPAGQLKKRDNVQSFQVHIYNERSTQSLSGWSTHNKERICTLSRLMDPEGAIGICF